MDPVELPAQIKGDSIILNRYVMEQAEEHNALINANKEHLKPYMDWWDQHKNLSDTKEYLAGAILKWEKFESFGYTIRLKTNDNIIGTISTVGLSWKNKAADLGYWLAHNYQGHGYMSEAVRLIENELFKIGMNRVSICTRTINKPSENVIKRNGYTYEGILRNNVIENDEVRSTVFYSKLLAEWEKENA